MTTPALPLSITRQLALVVMAIGGYAALFVGIFVSVPKAARAASEDPSLFPLPGWITFPSDHYSLMDDASSFWMALGLVLPLSFVISLLVFLPGRVRQVASATFFYSTLLTSALALYLMTVSSISLGTSYEMGEYTSSGYANLLGKYALLESADGTIDRVRKIIERGDRVTMQEVKDPALLPRDVQYRQVQMLLSVLRTQTDPAVAKRILATTYVFRDKVLSVADSKFISEQATFAGAPPATNAAAFYVWMGPKLGTEGWEPLPVYEFVKRK